MVQLEGQAQAALQKAMQANKERVAVQAALDKALDDLRRPRAGSPRPTRRWPRPKTASRWWRPSLAETQAERTRLSTALDEANHKHLDETNVQNARFEALQARAA